jgi:hypothetical protein
MEEKEEEVEREEEEEIKWLSVKYIPSQGVLMLLVQ